VAEQKIEYAKLTNLETRMMKTQVILRQNAIIFCTFEGECDFKKIATNKNEHPKAGYAVCTWKGHC